MFEDLIYRVVDGRAEITLNRPAKLNALRFVSYQELNQALLAAGEDPTVGVVVIKGAGRAFCAGGDLEMATNQLREARPARFHFFSRMIEVGHTMAMLSKPVICQVHGACVGGGAELVLFADFITAADDSYFHFNGTSIGGCSWWGAPQLLPLQVGLREAERILLLSERVSGERAARIGLVTASFPAPQLDDETLALCERLLDLSEEGLRLTKAALRSVKESMLTSMTAAAEASVAAVADADLHSAFDAVRTGQSFSWRDLRAT